MDENTLKKIAKVTAELKASEIKRKESDKENELENIEDAEEHIFTCIKCGCHDLIVRFNSVCCEEYIDYQKCNCGFSDDGFAYLMRYLTFTEIENCHYLDEDHRFDEEAPEYCDEEIESEIDNDIIEEEIFCEKCYNPDRECITERTEKPEEYDEDDTECTVFCADCEREIEFGWSHPDRGGRIWPAECLKFKPWSCWPEPRFKEKWAKKKWLRPTDKCKDH